MARIAVGGFQHETNTFAPQRATWADFERADAWPGFVRGPELIEAVEGYNIPIAGAVKTLQELGHQLVPLCWCSAPPSSYVERDAYERVAAAIIEDLMEAGPLNGVYLDLHGAMVAEHHEDGEGELLRRIRGLLGDGVPIVTSLDYHTNMTPEMVRHASAMVGYRTYPHIDMAATGGRAARLLDRLLTPEEAVAAALLLARYTTKPIVLADIQDNPGAGGTSDTVGLLRALIAQRAEGAVIGMIVDPEAAAAAEAAGEGALLDGAIGGKIGFAGEAPVAADWRVVRLGSGIFTGTGPMY